MPSTCHPKLIRRGPIAPRKAAALVELGVCLPIIMLLFFGTLEACELILLKQSITVAAYEGARTAILPDIQSSSVDTTCQQMLTDRNVVGATIAVTPSDLTGVVPGDYIAVEIVAPANGNCVLGVFSVDTQVTARVEMMVEF